MTGEMDEWKAGDRVARPGPFAPLDDNALGRLRLLALEERETRGILEDLTDTFARPRGTLQVLLRTDLLRDDDALRSKQMTTKSASSNRMEDKMKRYENAPLLGRQVVGRSSVAPQWSSCRDGDPSCNRRGGREGWGRSA